MLTNKLVLTFCSDNIDPGLSLTLSDRSGSLINDVSFGDCTENTVTVALSFPNTLYIKIKNISQNNHTIHLKNLILSGLALPDQILNQICHYRAPGRDSDIVTCHWHQDGIVKIDFFALDWIQYHLLYKNKIITT